MESEDDLDFADSTWCEDRGFKFVEPDVMWLPAGPMHIQIAYSGRDAEHSSLSLRYRCRDKKCQHSFDYGLLDDPTKRDVRRLMEALGAGAVTEVITTQVPLKHAPGGAIDRGAAP